LCSILTTHEKWHFNNKQVMMILGFIVFGMSVYTKQTFTDRWSSVISTGAVWVGIFSGLFMILIAFLGCYSARKNKKMLLCLYLICVGGLLALQSAAAAVLINYSSRFRTVYSANSADLTNTDDVYVNNAVLSVYSICCGGCDSNVVMAYNGGLKGCNRPDENYWTINTNSLPRFCNTTRQMQEASRLKVTWQSKPCSNTGPCVNPGDDNCWKYFDGSVSRGLYPYPPVAIDRTFCTMLQELSQNGNPIVGYPQQGGCANGSPGAFFLAIDAYFSPKMYYAGVVFALIAAIQGTVLFVGFYVICFVSKKDVVGDYDI
jgi:hypothetical protein